MLRWLPSWLTLGMAVAIVFVAGVGIGNWLFTSRTPVKTLFGYTPPPQTVFAEVYDRAEKEYIDPGMNGQKGQWAYWLNRYKSHIATRKDLDVAASSMLASLNDEYTRFLSEKSMNDQMMQIDAELTGIGVVILSHENHLMVTDVIENSPAKTANLMPGDEITKIDGQSTVGMNIHDAADHIRGKLGTEVQLTLQRNGKEFTQNVRRDRVHLQSVYTQPLEDNRIGYIRISSFLSETLMDELLEAIVQMQDKSAMVLDLRSNFGGLLENALTVSDLFLSEGTVVQIQSTRWGKLHTEKLMAHASESDVKQPMVVLMDGGTASASEIVSAALQENHRATLMGTTSFGKGLVQRVIPLQDGSGLNLSISKYLTPQGHDIHKKGIEPDVTLAMNPATAHLSVAAGRPSEDAQLKAAIAYLAKKL